MLIRSILTAVIATTLLLGGLVVPSAGSVGADVPSETLVEVVHGLPAAAAARGDGGYAAAGSAEAASGAGFAESEQLETPIAFSMVGFEVPDGADIAFRTSRDGSDWSGWADVHADNEDVPDPGSPEDVASHHGRGDTTGRVLTEPAWVGAARHLQVRVWGADPSQVAAHLIDSAGLHRSLARRTADAVAAAWRGSGPQVASAAAVQPAVTTRAEWGADESMRSGSVRTARRARVAFVHHTVTANDYAPGDGPAIMRGIYAYHVRSNGWSDIGYNLLVDRYGRVYEGRYGGLEQAVIGAHAGGFNTGTLGVAMIGDFQAAEPPADAMEALARVLAWKMELHHIDPTATARMTSGGSTRFASGTQVTLNTVSGHRDVSSTACPGGALYSGLPWLRRRVAELIGDAIFDHEAAPLMVRMQDGRPTNGPVQLAARLSPAGPWTLEVTDPDGAVVHTATGSGSTAASTWTPADGTQLGRYTYSFTSAGRLAATDHVDLLNDTFTRLGGTGDAIAGAVEVSKEAFPDAASAELAVVARSDLFADTLAGGPLAGSGGPLLLTGSAALDGRARAELERVLPAGSTVYVLGGTTALSERVVTDLSARWTVVRLAGPERTATAAEVARVVLARNESTTVMIARAGPDSASPWADALAGGAYGAARGIPVLLTPTDRLAVPARDLMQEAFVTDVIVLGGTAAVSEAVAGDLPRPRRISGSDRTATAVAIAEQLWGRRAGGADERLLLSGAFRGDAWTLALASAPLSARTNAPLLLTSAASLSGATAQYLDRLGYRAELGAKGWVLGSRDAVSDAAVAQAAGRLG